MATSIFFNGRRINVPGAYSKIDASALSSISSGAVGIVALVGEAEGGEPNTVADENDMTRGGQVFDQYRGGDLRTASLFAFEPSTDDAVPGGAQRIVPVKVNPSTQSAATLPDDNAVDASVLTSQDYGLFTEAINIDVAAGTTQGKLITIEFEGIVETFDDVGGLAAFTALYTPGTAGYDTVTGLITATQFTAAMSKAETGLVTERTADILVNGVVRVVSSDIGDTTQTITVYGLSSTDVAISETLTLNGTTDVDGVTLFTKILGAVLSAAAAGTVTLSDAVIPTTVLTLAPAALTAGVVLVTNAPVEGAITLTASADDPTDMAIWGEDAAGATVSERVDLTAANATPVVLTQLFRKITVMAIGDTAGGITMTVTGNAAQTSHSTFNTVQKLVDKLNTLDGMTATAVVSNPTTFLLTDMDYATPAASLLTPAADFFADLYFFNKAITDNSAYLDAARAVGGLAVPANTTTPVFVAGGVEGVTTIAEWQAAFSLLRKRRVNIIVPLTRDPAVHALLATHLVERAGRLRSEANGYVGLAQVSGAGLTLTNLKSEIQVLQTRHISALVQEPQRFDPDTGLATWYPPYIFAAIAAGMQAGSAIGEPLTRKRPLVTDVRNDSSWSVENDIETLLDAGAFVAEKVDNVGIRFVRSLTTHLADDNVVFTEMSANESANTAVFELRTALELKIGKRGLIGTVAGIKGLANDILGRLIDDDIIFAYRALQVEQVGDVFPVSVELAPILPINFIPVTVHLVAARAAA